MLYVEPIYIEAAGTASIPEVRQIVTGYQIGDQFIYGIGSNVQEALVNMFDSLDYQPPVTEPTEPVEPGDEPGVDEKQLNEIKDKVDELKQYIEELEELINSLLGGE